MHTSVKGLVLIEQFEGFVDHIYNDGTGVMTVGYGTTSADISPLPQFVTRQQAEDLLKRELAMKYEPAVEATGVPLNQNQFDALVSLAYNCGPGIVSNAYQIGRDLRARNMGAVALDFGRYVWAGGRILPGLVTRRDRERKLFQTPVQAPPPQRPKQRAKGVFVSSLEYDHDAAHVKVVGLPGRVESWGDVDEFIRLEVELAVGPKAGRGIWTGRVVGTSPR